jgi:hypothetical protein
MKRTTKYVGLDIHQASTVASVREDSGRVIARSVLQALKPAPVQSHVPLIAIGDPRPNGVREGPACRLHCGWN